MFIDATMGLKHVIDTIRKGIKAKRNQTATRNSVTTEDILALYDSDGFYKNEPLGFITRTSVNLKFITGWHLVH